MRKTAINRSQLPVKPSTAWGAMIMLDIAGAAGEKIAEFVSTREWQFYTDDGKGYQTGPHTKRNEWQERDVEYYDGMPREHYVDRSGVTYRAEAASGEIMVYAAACDAWGREKQ